MNREQLIYDFAKHLFWYETGDWVMINGIASSFGGTPQQLQDMYLTKAKHLLEWIEENNIEKA